MNNTEDPFVVKYITFDVVRLVDQNQKFYGNIKTVDAQRIARESGMDLVCFNKPQRNELAFCKILDFNKWKYENEKRHRKEKRINKKQTKEIRFSLTIADNDIHHKIRQVNEFLDEGDDVIVTMKLRGRERSHFSLAEEKMKNILDLCKEHGKEINRKKTNDMIIVRLIKHNPVENNNHQVTNQSSEVKTT